LISGKTKQAVELTVNHAKDPFKQGRRSRSARAQSVDITAVPTFVMGRRLLVGAPPYENLETLAAADGIGSSTELLIGLTDDIASARKWNAQESVPVFTTDGTAAADE
jgi:hypothetical protein